MPERVQQKRTKGWRKPENTVSVARPGRYGNPFRIVRAEPTPGRLEWAVALGDMIVQYVGTEDRARELAISFFRSWLEEEDHHDLPDPAELRGKNLMCFCSLDKACHVDVWLELANA